MAMSTPSAIVSKFRPLTFRRELPPSLVAFGYTSVFGPFPPGTSHVIVMSPSAMLL